MSPERNVTPLSGRAYKTTNISVLGLFAGDGGLEDILAADDPDGLISTSMASMIEWM
jgi:hypothetical protein